MSRKLVGVVAASVVGALVLGVSLRAVRAGDDDEDAKVEKIHKLLRLSGEAEDAAKMCRETLKQNAQLPPEYVKKFSEAANAKAFEDIFTPVYSKHFSEEDIDGLIAFYESPVGKKLAKKRFKLQKDAMDAGRLWGAKTGAKIAEQMQNPNGGDEGDDDDDKKPAPKKEAPKKDTPKKDEPKKEDF